MSTVWRKVWRDLWGNKVRTILVMLSIAVGVFAVGSVSSSFVMILNDMDADYQSANPHGAILYCAPFDDDLLDAVRRIPAVGQAEGRSGIAARVQLGPDELVPIEILSIPPVDEIQVDYLRPHTPGSDLTLEEQEILIERSVLGALPIASGDVLKVELAGGRIRELQVTAMVHDVTGFPYVFSGQISGFVTPDTMEWLGGSRDYNRLYFTVAENPKDEAHVRAVADEVADRVERGGREVYFTFILQPGRHFATDITQALGAIMGILGALAVFLSGFLVINTITALLAQHVRQIGVMKAVGGRTGQLVGMYVVLVLSFGLLALVVAVPLSAFMAYNVAAGIASFLNFSPGPFRVPLGALVLQAVVALVVPVGAALIPVWSGTRITIREAISDYGLGRGRFGRGLFDRLLENVRRLPRPLLISLRNTFRRKARLALTLSTLTLAGAIFIAVVNLHAAIDAAITETFGYLLSDVNVTLDRPFRLERVEPLAMRVPDVVGVEGWGGGIGEVLSDDKSTAVEVSILAPPAASTLIDPTMSAGRWLLPQDENGLAIGNHLISERPDLKVGDEIVIKIDDRETTWQIVGIYRMAGNVVPPIVYANYEYLTRVQNQIDRVSNLRVVTASSDMATQERAAKALEASFKEAGVQVAQITTGTDTIAQQTATTDILVIFLLIMAVLIALVGGLGLMGMMSMNVLERTREIGVMRAIGASDGAIMLLVIVEGMLVGLISWVLGAVLAIPISALMANVVGASMFQTPLDFVLSINGFLMWLGGVVVLSALASFLPARSAARLTIREVLAYE
jgi:putative ABC transport system permease protein